ncbi:MAG: hypothetical protein ACLUOF_11045 [Ruminococcus sp.]
MRYHVSVKGNDAIAQTVPVTVRHLEQKDGCTYVDGILIVNKSYGPPEAIPGLMPQQRLLLNR